MRPCNVCEKGSYRLSKCLNCGRWVCPNCLEEGRCKDQDECSIAQRGSVLNSRRCPQCSDGVLVVAEGYEACVSCNYAVKLTTQRS
jgi:hypothetical protein